MIEAAGLRAGRLGATELGCRLIGIVTLASVVARFRDLRGLASAAREDGFAPVSPLRS
jgi:hypothetical protein